MSGPVTPGMWRRAAHSAFDRLWMDLGGALTAGDGLSKRHAKAAQRIYRRQRTAAYAWLAAELGLPPAACHIRFFSVDTCRRVVALCNAANPNHVRRFRPGAAGQKAA